MRKLLNDFLVFHDNKVNLLFLWPKNKAEQFIIHSKPT